MSTENATFLDKINNWIKQSISLRLFTIGILILLMLIPVSMVESLIQEREYRQTEAISEVSEIWGKKQTLSGVVLTVPYRSISKVYDASNKNEVKIVETKEYIHFLPENLQISGNVYPKVRYRGIYEVIVYNSKIHVQGNFNRPNFDTWKIDSSLILWDEAFLSIGLTDLRSIQEDVAIQWNGEKYAFSPGVECSDVIDNGISTKISLNGTKNIMDNNTFNVDLNFNGSTDLSFIPLGKTTTVDIQSGWQDPSFMGAFLPDHRKINDKGFKAQWKVLHLNRPFPQQFRGPVSGLNDSSFGVSLIVPVDEYQKSTRSAKYAVIFIILTFTFFFFIQVINGLRIHPIQYIIVGLALCVFYTLLIALSEHIPYALAYLISSLSIIGMITLYARSIFNNRKLTWILCLMLTCLYLFIYSIIQMEDYSLLMGSIGLFIVLSTIMFLSRKINWYAIKNPNKNEG